MACDAATSICYSQYTVPGRGITYGIALPADADATGNYDAIISVTATTATKWAGFCWGGTMVFNPLTLSWPDGKGGATVSARFAFGLGLPQGYDGAEHFPMKGTMSNATHWTQTSLCKGCTQYQGGDGEIATLNSTGVVQFAWAEGTNPVSEPANNASSFSPHQNIGTWQHDLNAARSPKFESWVANNLLGPAATAAPTSATAASTMKTSTVATAKPIVTAAVPASCPNGGTPKFRSNLAAGWKATKVLGGLTSPRSIVFDTLGNMLVVQNGRGVSVHTMSADGCITSTKMLISANYLNHGLALSIDGKTIYASGSTAAYAYPYTASSQSVGARTTVVTGMYYGGSHTSRTLLIGAHAPNLLVVSHGSNANFDYAAGNPKTARAIVKVFDLDKTPNGGHNFVSGGWNAGYGLRNEVGITFDDNNMLWGVENSGDDFRRTVNGQSRDVHQDNPAEKLNYLGDITKPNDNWYGYPTCFAVWKASDFASEGLQIGDHFVVAPNNTFKDANCKTAVVAPSLVFQAHSAPIDSKFDAGSQNLYVTFHGSWNRNPTTGFKLVVVPFKKAADGAYVPVSPLNTQNGYSDVMWNPNVAGCAGNGPVASSGCFRPAGLGFDGSGRMYMTSDTSSDGELWVLGKS
ncbi:hypothetical protein BJ875DRAFT_502985 [Amylocarpus encephaloides]|uniref:Cellobiose dehydrogenase cytochrome domain-containing protein n=1 Tax=Amylocarpus encephaloides TaxID=45428 RepID=A0A9P8C854_9HELO|nr:hypothetical protein BJ875DRAFT_502985 [Amylocarpus encephaloides]